MFTKLDGVALGLALGSVTAPSLLLATLALASAAPRLIGPCSSWASTSPGSASAWPAVSSGSSTALAAGFAFGWVFAFLRNAALALYLTIAFGRAEKKFLRRLFDYM